MELSKHDLAIIKILKDNARTPYTQIGKMIGVSDAAIHQRVAKLMEAGVIERFTIEVNPEAMGKIITGFAFVNVNPGHLDEATDEIIKNENVLELYETHGPNDLLMKLVSSDLEGMRDTIVAIRQVSEVSSAELITCYKKWK